MASISGFKQQQSGHRLDRSTGPSTRLEQNPNSRAQRKGRRTGVSIFGRYRPLSLLLSLALIAIAFPASLRAQTFEPMSAMSFTMPVGGANPLPQIVAPISTAAAFNYYATASTTTGGNWLGIGTYYGCCGIPTGSATSVDINAPASLAAGTYTGKIVFTSNSNSAVTLTVPVTLIVEPATAAFLDNLPGEIGFSLLTAGNPPPSQSFQIRNAGTGSLSWTVAKSYVTGASWLTLSATSGTGPATVVASIETASLPGSGLEAGTYTALLTVQAGTDKTTIPVSVRVGAAIFRQMNPLNFVKGFGGANPNAQFLTAASTGASFPLTAVAVNSTGGNWLQISPTYFGCCGLATPQAFTVSVNPAVDLAAGSYTAEIIFASTDSTQTVAVPVTLTVSPLDTEFFDDLPGGMNFAMETGGDTPPGQSFQIRNAGTGTLAWTLTGSTSDGGAWLAVSAASGTAPSTVTVTVTPAKLPGAGETPGTYSGQLILQSASGRVTVPITFVVGAAVFRQVNPINFVMPYGGGDPLPQILTAASTGANFDFTASVVNSTGGSWLGINPNYFGCCGLPTPQGFTVSATPNAALAAGTYSAEIVLESTTGNQSMIVPVNLTVAPPTAAFFSDLPGQLSFSMVTGGSAPPAQTIQIRNAGEGTLSWTATASTSDGGKWLNISAASGTAPSLISATVVPDDLPGNGAVPGTFTGQVTLVSSTGRVTIPVTLTVGASVFRQANPINFVMSYGGGNPMAQILTVTTTGSSVDFTAVAVNSTGGNWLSISPNYFGCCGLATPQNLTVSANPATGLAAGTYSAEVVVKSTDGTLTMAVPVTLTVAPVASTFFDQLPGQLAFSMVTGGNAPPAQALQIRNAGTGTLAWTGSASTSDGGAWLELSSTSGTAPTNITAKIVPANLPGAGLTPGTFTGQVVLKTGDQLITIPVTVAVGPNVFQQTAALNFTKPYGGANPLPQVLTVASTGTSFGFYAVAVSSTGGNWLSINPSYYGCCGIATTQNLTVSVNAAAALAAGTYTAEVIVTSSDGSKSMAVPVTLTVAPVASTFFDNLPGQLGFSLKTGGAAPPTRTLQIRNGGTGTLDWTLGTSTSDGGKWLTVSATSGTALSNVTVSVVPSKLPGAGAVPGIYSGEIVLDTTGDRVTVPVTVIIGANVFKQLPVLNFSKSYQGANPASQTMTVDTTGTNFGFFAIAANGKGGNWLQITPNYYGCCGVSTPQAITVTVDAAVTLESGVYTGEVVLTSSDGSMAQTIPINLTVQGTAQVANLAFAPPGGTYSADQSVIISDSTQGASIFYTTDGTTPTTSSLTYSGPIPVDQSETLKAIAVAPGFLQSNTGTAVYKLTPPVTGTPITTVAIADATTGAVVYYTTDGTTPTTKSKVYTGPLTLTSSTTLKYIAVAPNHTQSPVITMVTTIP